MATLALSQDPSGAPKTAQDYSEQLRFAIGLLRTPQDCSGPLKTPQDSSGPLKTPQDPLVPLWRSQDRSIPFRTTQDYYRTA